MQQFETEKHEFLYSFALVEKSALVFGICCLDLLKWFVVNV